MELVLFRAKCK